MAGKRATAARFGALPALPGRESPESKKGRRDTEHDPARNVDGDEEAALLGVVARRDPRSDAGIRGRCQEGDDGEDTDHQHGVRSKTRDTPPMRRSTPS